MTGKILFFNANDGVGIIIVSTKKKLSFHVKEWNDFDIMPSLGLDVTFIYKNESVTAIYIINETSATSREEAPNKTQNREEPTQKSIPQEDVYQDNFEEEEEEEFQQKVTQDQNDNFNIIDDIEDDIGPREESVTLTLNLSMAVENYFETIEKSINTRIKHLSSQNNLDYLKMKRFLWTTFNNLNEIDLHIITPKIKSISDDLRQMATIFNDFTRKTKYPPLAYEEVFLSCQAEYMKIKIGTEKTIERLNSLRGNEAKIGSALKVKKSDLQKNIHTEEFAILNTELKSLNGTYVDIVHMMAELDERYKNDKALLVEFEKEYRDDFYSIFNKSAVKYKVDLVKILNSLAYILDSYLWRKAKTSKSVKVHFHKAGIHGEFNTKTYLKYFLDTQDSERASKETKLLFELYEYLSALEKDCIMVLTDSVEDAMEFEGSISMVDKKYMVKAFIDEKSALKWGIQNTVKVLVLNDTLSKIRVSTFLSYYKTYILAIPKIIILGNNQKNHSYSISKLLSKNISPRVLAQHVKELLTTKK
ncbi:hypothetical protein JHD48_06725 [Sulfurimonas sp. SAG-AH-194-I05]|nr:hypothetical protein [Sulfurimonas sp. SAG-AH-194-I05]MDF1875423.1 hypothetical protein [Sulfurimonas sp. SAG-AH-194-I05]